MPPLVDRNAAGATPHVTKTLGLLARCLIAFVCLVASAFPALATESAGPHAPAMSDLKRQANAAADRLNRAQSEQAHLRQQVKGLESQIADLETRMGALRQSATRSAANWYMRDGITDSAWAIDPGRASLGSARRLRLMGTLNELAGRAVRALDETAGRLRTEKTILERRRKEQDQVVARIAGERREVDRRLSAMVRAEREEQARQAALARASARASRNAAAAPVRAPVVRPSAFICPIRGPVAFSNDFGGRRNHKGNDLMSPKGTENVAVVAGNIMTRPWSGGGLTVFLSGDDGDLYIYMHLLRFVGELPRRVEQGEVVGLTGATGNASAYHTHFEIHPGGGAAVNPYPLIAAYC